jgi:hypothetical protein
MPRPALLLTLVQLLLQLLTRSRADSLDLSALPQTLDCGALTYSLNISYTAAASRTIFLYVYDGEDGITPWSSNFGSTSAAVSAAAVNTSLSLQVTLVKALPCFTAVYIAAVLSPVSDPSSFSSFANVTAQTTGTPIGCAFSFAFSPNLPLSPFVTSTSV